MLSETWVPLELQKTGRLVCKVVVSGAKGGVVVGTMCGAGTA